MNIKPTKLTIKNIGIWKGEHVIAINKPLILFYGDVRQGKSTILKCVPWVCGGAFPEDIISHGEKEGSIELEFEGGMIGRSFYRGSKDGKTTARAVNFIRNGKPVPSPVAEIKRLLNPILLDQDFLRNKSELERKQYFTELFAVDTTELDTELFTSQREAQTLRAKISGYGEINLTPVESVDIAALNSQLAQIRGDYGVTKAGLDAKLSIMDRDHEIACSSVDAENDIIRKHNSDVESSEFRVKNINSEIARHEEAIKNLRQELSLVKTGERKTLNPRPPAPDRSVIQKQIIDAEPDTSALEKQIQDAGATNVRAEQYQANKKRADEKKADETKLSALEKRQREIKAEKQAKLKSIGESCGIKDLSFDDSGNFIYQGTTAGMISDSQIMRLSSDLSALYPDGFGLDLIDRGESLGKSIFEFVDRAKAENKSILATIVGERPANVPAEIGVFVVERGNVQ